ncbi:MAG: type III toxin-antitoxin system ToxN/AbiQ family toxin, partial [Vibrionaceae bacterium]
MWLKVLAVSLIFRSDVTIYFVRPSYLQHLNIADSSVNLLGNKVKRPFLLMNATVRQTSTDFLVPLTNATSNRVNKALLHENLAKPQISRGIVIYDESKEPVSIARFNWMVPYNANAVEKLDIDTLFDGRHKTELRTILRVLRNERTGEPTEMATLLAPRAQQMVDLAESS